MRPPADAACGVRTDRTCAICRRAHVPAEEGPHAAPPHQKSHSGHKKHSQDTFRSVLSALVYYMKDRPPPKRLVEPARSGAQNTVRAAEARGKRKQATSGGAAGSAPVVSPQDAHENPRHALGRLGERMAAAHLERLGFAIVARNVRTRYGEIDLIAFDGTTLVFAEVKTRRARRRWRVEPEEQPLAWLRTRQRLRLRRLAAAWLHSESTSRPSAHTIRFDAIGVVVDEAGELRCLDHVESAW